MKMKAKMILTAVLLIAFTGGCGDSPETIKIKAEQKQAEQQQAEWSKWVNRDHITIDGQRVYMNMTSDASVKILNPGGKYGESPYTKSDPTVIHLGSSLRVIQHFQFRNGIIQVDITYERVVDPGPYRITKIVRRQKTSKAASYSKKAKKENQKQVNLNSPKQSRHKSRCVRLIKLSQNREALEQMSLKELEKLYIDLSNCE